MSKTWKWILGILIALAIVALIAAPFILRATVRFPANADNFPPARAWDRVPGRGLDNWNRHPMMFNGGFFPFGGLFMGVGMLLSLLVPAGILFLVIYGAVRLALKNSPPPVVPASGLHPCPDCGYLLQPNWKHCPQCGKQQ